MLIFQQNYWHNNCDSIWKRKDRKMFGFGVPEIVLVLFIIVLLFGAKKIPDIIKGVGKGIKGFKDEMNTDN